MVGRDLSSPLVFSSAECSSSALSDAVVVYSINDGLERGHCIGAKEIVQRSVFISRAHALNLNSL